MRNIPTRFFGYDKDTVDNIISKKDDLLSTQQQDIDYLRFEISRLEKNLEKKR